MELARKLKAYYITSIFGVIFALAGFSYNAWRLESTEDNSNIRTASFEVLIKLAELEQLIYAAHYDKDTQEGNPRKGWVKIGLIVDLSSLIGPSAEAQAKKLKTAWEDNWQLMAGNRDATDILVAEIDLVRREIKLTLTKLE